MSRKDNMQLVFEVLSKLSQNPNFIFKGGVLLYSELMKNKMKTIRYTEDLDMNTSLGNEESLTDELTNSGLVIQEITHLPKFNSFSVMLDNGVDLDIKVAETHDVFCYEINGIDFKGMSHYEIMSDKLSVVSSRLIYRRVKDLLDVYLWINMFEYNGYKLSGTIENRNKELDNFSHLSVDNEKLIHAYSKLRDVENKPPLQEVVSKVTKFIEPVTIGGSFKDKNNWDKEKLEWRNYLN